MLPGPLYRGIFCMVNNSLFFMEKFVTSYGPLDISGSMTTSPTMTTTSSFLSELASILNVDLVHSMGACSSPPSYGNLGNPSLKYIMQSSSNCLMVQEAPTISIPLVKDVESKEMIYSSSALIC